MAADDADVLVEAEDGAGQEERLSDVVEQARGHIADVDDLVGYHQDAAHDEQRRAEVLGCLESVVFHGVRCMFLIIYKGTKKN